MNEKNHTNQEALYIRISGDGFMCKIPDGKNDAAVLHLDLKDLEEILQAVKKTQEKLVNKQIQEIQDSKNNSIENVGRLQFDLEYKDPIEQNQKVVDRVIMELKQIEIAIKACEETTDVSAATELRKRRNSLNKLLNLN